MRTITESESTPKADGFHMPASSSPGAMHCAST